MPWLSDFFACDCQCCRRRAECPIGSSGGIGGSCRSSGSRLVLSSCLAEDNSWMDLLSVVDDRYNDTVAPQTNVNITFVVVVIPFIVFVFVFVCCLFLCGSQLRTAVGRSVHVCVSI